jgi:hypothetical protein
MNKTAALVLLLSACSAKAAPITIDFNDGTNGAQIGSFYSLLGVTFSNARWDDFVSNDEGDVGAGGLKLVGNAEGPTNIYEVKAANPIVAVFSAGISDFSIYGLNVGFTGARIDLYDAVSGGNLIDSDEAYGISTGSFNHPLLTSSATPIYRVELYQPSASFGEGMLWENMSFTAIVPIPAAVWLFSSAFAALAYARRRLGAP